MSTSESFRALRRANPRARDGFAASVDSVRAGIRLDTPAPLRRRMPRLALAATLAAAAVVAGAVMLGSRGSGVENATAAVQRAATTTAASAERSGTAAVRMTHNGSVWTDSTIRWHGRDLSVTRNTPDRRGKVGSQTLLVGGMMYGVIEGRWFELGPPSSIDPDSGTTPAETLAAVRADVGGATLRRISGGMSAATTTHLGDGSTVYRGKVAAGLIARESGFKEGQTIRVLPFGYVANDEASNPATLLDTAVTVNANGVVRQLAVTWGTWSYTVTYSALGQTSALKAPENARSLLKERLRAAAASG